MRFIFNEIKDSGYAKIICSIVWGLGLASLFKRVCTGRKCIVYRSPPPKDVQGNIYNYNSKCYKFSPRTTECTHDSISNE